MMTADTFFWHCVAAVGILVAGAAVLGELRARRHTRRKEGKK